MVHQDPSLQTGAGGGLAGQMETDVHVAGLLLNDFQWFFKDPPVGVRGRKYHPENHAGDQGIFRSMATEMNLGSNRTNAIAYPVKGHVR